MKWLLLILFIGIVSCQQKPRTIGVTDSGVLIEKDYRKVILADAVVFDTRPPFFFNTNKIPGSINLPVTDFVVDQDKMDAARRLSLYGVNQDSSVVIVGLGSGDEPKLAWEFIKLGVTKIETLNVDVFRLLNLKPEPARKNVALWKPSSQFEDLNTKQFHKKIEELKPEPSSRARANSFQGFPAPSVLKRRVLVISSDEGWEKINKYSYADHFVFNDQNLFDEKGLLNLSQLKNQKFDSDLKRYDAIFLIDSSSKKYARAYALVQFGAKSLYLVF